MIITVSIALILLGRIVSTRVSGVLGRILLLANYKNFRSKIFLNLNSPECYVKFLHGVVFNLVFVFKLNLTAL